MAVPAHDTRDWEFAKKFGLPIIEVVKGNTPSNLDEAAFTDVATGKLVKMCIRDRVYIPHDMSFAGSALKQGYRNLDGTSAEFFVRCRHGQGLSLIHI